MVEFDNESKVREWTEIYDSITFECSEWIKADGTIHIHKEPITE